MPNYRLPVGAYEQGCVLPVVSPMQTLVLLLERLLVVILRVLSGRLPAVVVVSIHRQETHGHNAIVC